MAFGVQYGEVVLPLARHLEAGFLQGSDDVGAVLNRARKNLRSQERVDGLPGLGAGAGEAPGHCRAPAGGVVRMRPSVLSVQRPLKRIVGAFPAGRGDVVALAGSKVAPGRQEVHVHTAVVPMEHGRPGIAIRLQPGPRDALEGVERLLDLGVGGLVLGRPRDHA